MAEHPADPKRAEAGFARLIVDDVVDAYNGLEIADLPSTRRNVIRATFAAIEGLVWETREQVREISADMGYLTPLADLALREQNFTVTERGEIVEQVRYVTLTASIRLTVRQVQTFAPALTIDFGSPGWQSLRLAIAVRNRVTHPKTASDLIVSDDDLEIARAGLFWLIEVTEQVQRAAVDSFARHAKDYRELVERLKQGDPIALRAYRHALENPDGD